MQLQTIVKPLISWYHNCKRSLPWRDEPTPYRVWVSEIMLQQTRVDPAIPYFERFVSTLPDIAALADANEETVLKLWEGLGYYSRVRNLQKAARIIQNEYGGILPSEPAVLIKLPGIGEYTAGAIASIAYQVPVPAVDGNVLRVISRLTADERDIAAPETKKKMQENLQAIMPDQRPGDFNQALMDLGATVCLPNGTPRCEACPLAHLCEAKKAGRCEDLPIKSKKTAPVTEKKTVFLLRYRDQVALLKRPDSGLLAGLWEFPNTEGHLSRKDALLQLKQWGVAVEKAEVLPKAKHVFTHRVWDMKGFSAILSAPSDSFVWADAEQLSGEFTLPTAFRAYQKLLKKE